eukprot:TRINITY_DN1924_c0_g1_i2.p1 TRINITY_DN1924_c0_g1~~TRINITY_DN1924_c0_g1_i2.p1  ORF type:complete len:338 (+),score=69.76 TRINITY_DN1924_c0_g1_i2:96-1109(+)
MPSALLDALSIITTQYQDDLVVDVHKLRFEKYQVKDSDLDPRLKEVLERRQQKQNAAEAELEAIANAEALAMQPRKLRCELFLSQSNSKDVKASTTSVSRQNQLQKGYKSQKQAPKEVVMAQRPMQSEQEQVASEKAATPKKEPKIKKDKSRGEGGKIRSANKKSQLQVSANIAVETWNTLWQDAEGNWATHPSEQFLTTYDSQETWNAHGQNQQHQYAQEQHDHPQQQLHHYVARYDRTPSPAPRVTTPTAEGCRRMEFLLQEAQHRQHYDGQQQHLSWQSWEACDFSNRQLSGQSLEAGDLSRMHRKKIHLVQFQPIQYGVRGNDGPEDFGDMYE